MVKRSSTIEKKFKPSQAALDAWHEGDLWKLHAACGWPRGNSHRCLKIASAPTVYLTAKTRT